MPKEYYFGSNWFNVHNFNDSVTAIGEPYHSEQVVSYYIWSVGDIALIDTGMGLADIRQVLPSADPLVYLTHSHWDHIGSAGDFSNVSILDNQFELDRLKRGWLPDEMFGFEPEEFTIEIPKNSNIGLHTIQPLKDPKTFKDGDELRVGQKSLKVIHTPGHSPGSVSFYIEESGELFSGDTVYQAREYLHLAESDVDDYLDSLKRLLAETPGLSKIYPGHNAMKVGAMVCKPQLIVNHIRALENDSRVPLLYEQEGEDEFGPFVLKAYDGFSLALPRKV